MKLSHRILMFLTRCVEKGIDLVIDGSRVYEDFCKKFRHV